MSDQNQLPEHTAAAEGMGGTANPRMTPGEGGQTLTTRQGHPVRNNQNQRTVGTRGPSVLENYHFLEKTGGVVLHLRQLGRTAGCCTAVTGGWPDPAH